MIIIKAITKLNRWGNSLAIRIPSKIVAALNLDENSNLHILIQDNKIIIQKRLSLKEKCNLINDKNRNIDSDWNNDSVSKEW